VKPFGKGQPDLPISVAWPLVRVAASDLLAILFIPEIKS
jgi:hypothetical protein